MQNTIWIIVWAVIIGGVFIWLWRSGNLVRFKDYIKATREELRKCSWPTWGELKGSTVVVFISIAILGGFTVAIDQILFKISMFFKL
jgi:preprotein translocase subunit SecE